MERLELYDLDKLVTTPWINGQLPPPLPPPRKTQFRRPSMNPSFERYQFLCNMSRSKTDPIYAATPMFTTIPQSIHDKTHRQLLGTYIRLENVKPVEPTIPKSPEPMTNETTEEREEEEEEEENDDDDDKENEDGDDDNDFSGSGSSSDENDNDDDDDILEDDDEKKGVVEQIITRDKKN